jgi:hypothetical protein
MAGGSLAGKRHAIPEVGIRLHDVPEETYYLVRWQQPYRFTMVKISDHTFPGCAEPDGAAAGHRTLF